MKFQSPKKKELRWTQKELSWPNTYGTPLWIKKSQTPELSLSPTSKKQVLTFLSPKPRGRRKSIAAAPRINDSFIQTGKFQLSDNEDINPLEDLYNSCKKGRRKRRSTGVVSFSDREEYGGELRPYLPCNGSPKRRRVASCHRSAIDRLHTTYTMIDHWQEQMNIILSEDWNYKRKHWIQQSQNIL